MPSTRKRFKTVWRGVSRSFREVRCLGELLRYMALPEEELMADIPHGDGRPVLVIPGFLCGDAATRLLRRFLTRLGYTSFAWRQGINWGPKAGVRTRLLHRLREIHDTYEQKVTIVGWSLGGYYARELACTRPDLVREVVTLGSPIHGNPATTAVWHAFRMLNRSNMPQLAWGEIDFPQPEGVPTLAIFSKSDGIVPWRHCIPQRGCIGDSLRVRGSHIGLVANPEVMRLLGRHLGARRASKQPKRWLRRQKQGIVAAALRQGRARARSVRFHWRSGPASRRHSLPTVTDVPSIPPVPAYFQECCYRGVVDAELRAHLRPVPPPVGARGGRRTPSTT